MKTKLHKIYIYLDYEIFLPFCAMLPFSLGRFLASLRGKFYYYIKRDWREFSFGDKGLWNRTLESFKEICPNDNSSKYLEYVEKRYISQSLEEYEAMLIIKNRFHKIPVKYYNENAVLELFEKNPHHVFVTSHFASSIEAFIFLNIFKTPNMIMTSNITKHPMVHKSINKFYDKKYRSIEAFLNGGKMLDAEGNLKQFFRFIKNKGCLTIVADLPPSNPEESDVIKDFFSKKRVFAEGAQRLSQSVKGTVIPYVCYYEKGEYHMVFANLKQDPYEFFEQEIKKRPHLWWAADVLTLLPVKKESN